ncbi:hypothetical protein HTZ84_02195 [Haloterrigena sp. SYSU A558-1]|uniref:Uncharacterized protein n=1 Tax=Haloterrigena gelatinilytica TaxID=2741724 RepID=A0ABX2LEG5_9EURY|nr:hypothetical protein [Haloterrigena gelatinilytica]
MGPVRSDRAVSTVLDVAFALLLVSASVLLLGLSLPTTDGSLEETRADRTAETLSGSTVAVSYDLESIAESDRYEEPETVDDYERTTYGSATGVLAEAAVANATIGDGRLIRYADSFADSVAASVDGRFTGSNRNVHVVASWRPYEDASIRGEVTAGQRPPPTADTTAATTTASSGTPALNSSELATAYADEEDIDALAEPIARSIVRGYFPPERTQLTLERRGLDRAVTTTHYLELADRLDPDHDLERDAGPLRRSDARADDANEVLIAGLTELIADDLESGPIGDELDAIGGDEAELDAFFEKTIAPSDVDITTYTWKE